MIDFYKVWLPQIIGYARLIGEDDRLRDCWIDGKCGHTSVTSPDELIEQIFDDLDSDSIAAQYLQKSLIPQIFKSTINEFISLLKKLDDCQNHGELSAPSEVLSSELWRTITICAKKLSDIANATGYKAML